MLTSADANDQVLVAVVAFLAVLVMHLPAFGKFLAEGCFSNSNVMPSIAGDGTPSVRFRIAMPGAPFATAFA